MRLREDEVEAFIDGLVDLVEESRQVKRKMKRDLRKEFCRKNKDNHGKTK